MNRTTRTARPPQPAPRAAEPRVSSRRAAPPTGTPHDGPWCGIPGSVWPGRGWASPPGCAPSWILVKINPVLAEPRTTGYWERARRSWSTDMNANEFQRES